MRDMEKIDNEHGAKSYLHLTEFPDGSVRIEKMWKNGVVSDGYNTVSMQLSRNAIERLIPMLQEMLHGKFGVNQ